MNARARDALTISAVIAAEVHLFPFRTEKLSPPAPMVLGGQPPGRVGRRRINFARAGLWPALARFEANAAHLLRWSQFKARVSGLGHEEAAELGPLLLRTGAVVDELVKPDQVYTCLWSHAGGAPVHIHYVVQPATRELMARYDEYGPHLQVAMFDAEIYPPETEVAAFAEQARAAFRS